MPKDASLIPDRHGIRDVIRLSRSMVGEAEQAAVSRVIQRGYLGTGPETAAFEAELSAFIGGSRPVVCVNSGTAALQLALQACGIGPGDEVLVPSLTFVASFQAISATGATPVACDVRLGDGTLDVEDATRRISPRTRAVMPVHYASQPGDLAAVYRMAASNGLRVVEDAAHAFGCLLDGARVGARGDVICFSFDGIKNITSGEGGAVVTEDPDVVRRVQDARLLGVERDTERRYRSERSWDFDVSHQGWRYHMSDLMAAIGRAQLLRLEPEFAPRRIELARSYRERLNGLEGLALLDAHPAYIIPHIFPVRALHGRRDAVRAHLIERGCQVGIHYKPGHLLTFYREGSGSLPVAEQLGRELMSIPLHPELSDEEQNRVVELLAEALEHTSRRRES